MGIRALFVAKAKSASTGIKGDAIPSAAQSSGSVGVFITPQSIMSFPVASLAVTVTWAVRRKLLGAWGDKPGIPVAASLVIGGLILLASSGDPATKPRSRREWIVAGGVAFFNSLYLAAVTLGLLKP